MSEIVSTLQCAQAAIEAYTAVSGSHGGVSWDLVDLVADLMHFAQARDLDPVTILENAQRHFSAESELAEGISKVTLHP